MCINQRATAHPARPLAPELAAAAGCVAAPAWGRREAHDFTVGLAKGWAEAGMERTMSEFDKLKNEAEQEAQQHPQQVKEAEQTVEKDLGFQQQGQAQQGQDQQSQDNTGSGEQGQDPAGQRQ